jgi:uncharacterized protein YndB with AHSA1/START domain
MTDADAAPRIRLVRRIEARPAAVYAYLTDSEKWARWQGESAEIEARVGGVFRMTMGNGSVAEGRFLELEPDRRVRFTWGWRGSPTLPPGSSEVTIDLVDDGGITVLTLTHDGLVGDDIPLHTLGWEHYVPRLVARSEGHDPGPDLGPSAPKP